MTSLSLRRLAILMAAACLTACATPIPGADDNAKISADRFKPKVVSEQEEIRLALHAQGLTQAQTTALASFAEAWRENSSQKIIIQAPNGARDPAAAYRMADGARTFLVGQGLPEDKLEIAGYDPAGDAAAPLIVGYVRYRAELPECGKNWPNIAHSNSNKPQPNFGCAVTANMAAQIADPGDLLSPRDMTPQDATRRQNVLDKYRAGEKTSAERDDGADGAVSTAVK